MKLCRLIYRSDTSWDLLSNASLRELAEKSARNNAKREITGLLVLSGEHFLQVLEGPSRAVNDLYPKIVADQRHTDVTLVSYEQVPDRSFREWSMHVVDLYDLPLEHRELLRRKYPEEEGCIRIPEDAATTFALLLDARAICLSEAERPSPTPPRS